MKVFDFQNYVNNLPDCYDKTPIEQISEGKYKGSNNSKILEVEKISIQSLYDDIVAIFENLDIEQATSGTLDLYGEMFNQPRGLATDEQYRLMIKSKILQNLSSGDFNSVLNAIYMTFNCQPSQISIVETEPATVKVEKLPFDVITKADMSVSQISAILKRLLPTGVTLSELDIEGTFELCDTEEDMDIDGDVKGLTDTEEHIDTVKYPLELKLGGSLSEIYATNDNELPI